MPLISIMSSINCMDMDATVTRGEKIWPVMFSPLKKQRKKRACRNYLGLVGQTAAEKIGWAGKK